MYKFVCEENMCTGCRACVDTCTRNAIRIESDLEQICAIIDETRCVDCGLCMAVCPNHHPAESAEPIAWSQGWCREETDRQKGASGGVATAIAKTVIREGGIVGSCFFSKGQFLFKLVESTEELEAFRGSKYVKSDATGVYKAINQKLLQGRTVLFVGLPCQVAGLKNFVKPKLAEKLITVDLICHGTPSQELLSSFFRQHGKEMASIDRMEFRRGNDFRLYTDGVPLLHPRVQDTYTLSFLKSLNYTENCYHCKYAKLERVGDITLGDSWGSLLPDSEKRKGISLVLCQTEKGLEWVRKADIHLESVDLKEAVRNNHQLNQPAEKPKQRDKFIEAVKSGRSYDWSVARTYPKECAKLVLKRIILKIIDTVKFQ